MCVAISLPIILSSRFQLSCLDITMLFSGTSCSVFQYWLSKFPRGLVVQALGGYVAGEIALWVRWEGAWPASVTQSPTWAWWLLRHSCHPSTLSLCLDHWALLSEICWSLRQHCLGHQRTKNWLGNLSSPSYCRELQQHISGLSFLSPNLHPRFTQFAYLWILWCTDLSDMIVCKLGVIC